MPELPEVETVRRGIAPVFTGSRLRHVDIRTAKLRFDLPIDLAQRLMGARVIYVGRRGKYLHLDTDRSDSLILHLGMSGKILISDHDPNWQPNKHDHLRFVTDSGKDVVFNDARRFGVCDITPTSGLWAHKFFAAMGPEPLTDDFDHHTLIDGLRGKRTPIKVALLDQKLVVGVGNIYASEALFRAAISPKRLSCNLGPARIKRLVPAIKEVLAEAIQSGGSTLRDYVRSDGDLGYFQHNFAVYDRGGQPCRRAGCGGVVKQMVQAGRSTYYCGQCQR